MLCGLCLAGPIQALAIGNHGIWSGSMSTLFVNSQSLPHLQPSAAAEGHQTNSWLALLDRLLACSYRMHQRAGLRAIADDPHLLADLGLTREEALEQADTPFWR
jgi:uncharacterized protein YjiS (DUF1127 family)